MLTLIALLGTSAFAATPALLCGTATAPVACDPANDVDKDGYFTNAIDAKMVDCMDDPAANWLASSIHPFAKPILGDDAVTDSDCDATVNGGDEADELAAAEAAAKTGWSALEKSIGLCIESDRELDDGDFVWAYKKGTGYTCVFKKDAGYDGWSYDRESGVKDRSVVVESRRRIAGDRASSTTIGTRGTPAVAAVPATKDTAAIPAVAAVPGTGLYLEIEKLQAQIASSEGAVADRLRKNLEEVQGIIDANEGRMTSVENEVFGVRDRRGNVIIPGLDTRVDDLEASRPIFEVGVSGLLYAGRSLLEYEDGPVIRSGVGGGAAFVATTGYAWEGHQLYLDLAFSQGGEGSGDSSLPLSLGFASVGHQWTVGNIAAGLEGVIFVSSMGNPLDSTVSSWGIGGGGKGAYYVPGTPLAIVTRVDIVADSYGTNRVYNSGAGVVGTLGISLGPVR